jgi:type IV pilus assembly protein PilC
MPLYRYKARNRMGEMITGTYQATRKMEVIQMLKLRDCYPVLIEEQRKGPESTFAKWFARRISHRDLAVFCRQFATMVNAGVPILACLDMLRKQTENARLREKVEELYEEVQKGKSLSLIMGKHNEVFPELLVNMVEAGEVSGTLDRIMDRMAVHYEKEYRLNQKVRNALVYPSLIAAVAILVIMFLVTVVLPTFVSMFQQMGAVLPLSTRVLMKLSHFIKDRWLILLTGFIGVLFSVKWYSNTPTGKELFDKVRLKMPVIGKVNRKVVTVRFARTLGALLSSGIPLLQGIEVTGKVVGNTVVQRGIKEVEREIKGGRGLAVPLQRLEAFPPMLIHMTKVGEETGTLDYILEKAADFYDQEVENSVNRMTTLLEPVIIIVMATVVAFIVISIVVPMFEMMTQFSF